MEYDTYKIIKAILAHERLSPSQRLVAIIIAMHFYRPIQLSLVKIDTVCKETGLCKRTVTACITELFRQKIFTSLRTGRASYYAVGEYVVIWLMQNLHEQNMQNLHVLQKDTDSAGEKRYKSEMNRARREQSHNYPKKRKINKDFVLG